MLCLLCSHVSRHTLLLWHFLPVYDFLVPRRLTYFLHRHFSFLKMPFRLTSQQKIVTKIHNLFLKCKHKTKTYWANGWGQTIWYPFPFRRTHSCFHPRQHVGLQGHNLNVDSEPCLDLLERYYNICGEDQSSDTKGCYYFLFHAKGGWNLFPKY